MLFFPFFYSKLFMPVMQISWKHQEDERIISEKKAWIATHAFVKWKQGPSLFLSAELRPLERLLIEKASRITTNETTIRYAMVKSIFIKRSSINCVAHSRLLFRRAHFSLSTRFIFFLPPLSIAMCVSISQHNFNFFSLPCLLRMQNVQMWSQNVAKAKNKYISS